MRARWQAGGDRSYLGANFRRDHVRPVADMPAIRLVSTMEQRKSPFPACVVFAVLTMLGGCDWPTYNPAKLKAIKAEAQALAANHPIKPPQEWNGIPKNQWPTAIA